VTLVDNVQLYVAVLPFLCFFAEYQKSVSLCLSSMPFNSY